MNRSNRQIVLAARPDGNARLGDFTINEQPIPSPRDGEVLVRNLLISMDPYQRSLMGNASSELPPIDIGQPMPGPTVAIVERSHHADFAVGDHVVSWSGWQEHAVSDGSDLMKIAPGDAPLSTALGVLGHTGLTAWLGVTRFMSPTPGGTFVVTGAAGSVGSMAGQIARLRGHRVIGIAGGADKIRSLTGEFGFDDAVDYKAPDVAERLARALPDGVDALFDNVGGPMFEALMPHFNRKAQIVVCGAIANYSRPGAAAGQNRLPELLKLVLYRFIEIRGFALPDHLDSYPDFLAEARPWVAAGKIRYSEDFVDGLENIPAAFLRLFDGTNRGKLIACVG